MRIVFGSAVLLFSFATIAVLQRGPITSQLPVPADEPNVQAKTKKRVLDSEEFIPKGTKPIGLIIHNGDLPPAGSEVGMLIDVVGEECNPPTTGFALINVRVVAFDCIPIGAKEQGIVVALTPSQEEVVELMTKYDTKNRIVFHIKGSQANQNPD